MVTGAAAGVEESRAKQHHHKDDSAAGGNGGQAVPLQPTDKGEAACLLHTGPLYRMVVLSHAIVLSRMHRG